MPVIYLVEPTAANLEYITQDLQKGLYSPAYINFLSSISRPLLEDFAAQTAQAGTAESISQVYDQYLNFIVSEPNLFSLGMGKETYWTMNSAQTSDEDIDSNVDRIVSGLFSVSVTMGKLFGWCARSGASDRYRHNTHHPMPKGWCSRDDRGEARSKTTRPRSQR